MQLSVYSAVYTGQILTYQHHHIHSFSGKDINHMSMSLPIRPYPCRMPL